VTMTVAGYKYMQILGANTICALMPLAAIGIRVQFTEIMSQSPTSSRSWHIAHWPLLAWLETIIKLAALTIGIIAGINALSVGGFALPTGLQLAQFVILLVLSLGLIAAIFDRIADREIIAMIFVVVNNVGHWGMLLGLATGSEYLLWFAGLMLLGDLVKLWFIRMHDFTVRDYAPRILYILTLVYVGGYMLLVLLEWMR
jgi:hypothetical protein